MTKIILITGGQRSGKSQYAEKLALQLSPNPVYIATAHVWDEEFRERVRRHQERRGKEWTNIEEETALSRHTVAGRVVLIDCLTLWATNFFFQLQDVDSALRQMKLEFDKFTSQDATFIFVTNEIGSGGVSADAVQRKFTDLLGWMNQYAAQKAEEVYLMVSGISIPLTPITGQSSPTLSSSDIGGTQSGWQPPEVSPSLSERGLGGEAFDESFRTIVQAKIDNLNKPKGSLGRLEELAMQVCMVQHSLTPSLAHPCHLLLGADHGIEHEGVSVSPREVTWQQMINFTHGGGGVNLFCRQHGFHLRIVDVGVDYDLSHVDGIINRKIAHGTRNFLYEAALSENDMQQCFEIGNSLVDECAEEGCKVICLGEMGIGNTSASSLWMSLLADIPLDDCIGAGAGLNNTGIAHKREVLHSALQRVEGNQLSVSEIIRQFGGFEMVTAVGAMLHAAEKGMIILVDGFIMTACALAAVRLCPTVKEYMIFCHCGDESGHKRMLDALGAKPLLNFGLRLGEGTGALCAFPLVDSAVRMVNEMNNFDNAKITKYF